MEANRLADWKQKCDEAKSDLEISPYQRVDLIEYVRDLHNCIVYIDQQQAEIERLNRAYEVIEKSLRHFSLGDVVVKRALAEAQRIKEGDGEQG